MEWVQGEDGDSSYEYPIVVFCSPVLVVYSGVQNRIGMPKQYHREKQAAD